jgi:cell wall-associated NlpC family hydrolase
LHLAFEAPGTGSASASNPAAAYPAVTASASPGLSPAAGTAGAAAGAAGAAGQAPVSGGGSAQAVSYGAPGASVADTAAAGTAAAGTAAATAGAAGGSAVAGDIAAHLVAASSAPSVSDPSYASPQAHEAFEAAKGELGVPYQWGGTSPATGFDCSGLVQWAYHQAGITLPRVAADQFDVGTPVSLADLREGDLVFFKDSTGYIHHVGMYVGNHMFIEAPSTGEVVKYASLDNPYWAQQFAGARRIVPLDVGAQAGASAGGMNANDATAGAATAGTGGADQAQAAADPSAATASPADVTADPSAASPGVSVSVVSPAPAPAPAPPSIDTATFRALEHQERSFRNHTVQFLQAVQPAPGSPLAAPGAQAVPAGDQVSVDVTTGAAGQGATPSLLGVSEQVAGQGSGALPLGGVLSVSSQHLTSGQETFAARLASLTGLSPRVIAAWELAEESGSAAQWRQGQSNFNWLNIGYFDSGPGQIAFNQAFSDPVTAAEQTAKFLKGEWGGASASIRAILGSVGQSPNQQMAAIADSDWASTHYDGGASLQGTYQELSDLVVQTEAA